MSLSKRLAECCDELGAMSSDLDGLQQVLEQFCDSHPDISQSLTISLMSRVANYISRDMVALVQVLNQLGIEASEVGAGRTA